MAEAQTAAVIDKLLEQIKQLTLQIAIYEAAQDATNIPGDEDGEH